MVFLAAGRCQNVLLLSVVGLHLNQLFSFYNMPFVVINLIQINLTVFFGAGAERAVKEFQEFVGLIADGIAGKDTWASLLTSSGNPNRKGTGCDRAHPLTKEIASALAADGRKVIGRYIGGGLWKRLKREEIEIITETGMDIFSDLPDRR